MNPGGANLQNRPLGALYCLAFWEFDRSGAFDPLRSERTAESFALVRRPRAPRAAALVLKRSPIELRRGDSHLGGRPGLFSADFFFSAKHLQRAPPKELENTRKASRERTSTSTRVAGILPDAGDVKKSAVGQRWEHEIPIIGARGRPLPLSAFSRQTPSIDGFLQTTFQAVTRVSSRSRGLPRFDQRRASPVNVDLSGGGGLQLLLQVDVLNSESQKQHLHSL